MADPALAAALTNVDTDSILADGDLLGRYLETFVVAQLRAQMPMCQTRPKLYHLRQQDGRHEVDIIVELAGHRVIAIEVKAGGGPTLGSAKHLTWLRDQLGDRFVQALCCTPARIVTRLEDKITALPISALWS